MLEKELRAPRATKAALAIMVLASLVACGGGGSSEADTPFQVSVATTDTTARTETLSAGETVTLEVGSGTRLTFKSDGETRWAPVSANASYVVNSFSFNEKVVTVESIIGGEVAFSISSKSSPERSAVLKVKVVAQRFAAVKPNVGQTRTMKSTTRADDGSEYSQTRTYEVIAVREDGGYDNRATWDGSDWGWTGTYDANDNELSYVGGNNNKCTFTPASTWVGAPMYFGKSWISESQVVCEDDYSYSLKVTGKVDGYAEVNVPAGKYYALKLEQTDVTTHSNPASPTGKDVWTSQQVCWWATEIGRLVKCDGTVSAKLPSETVSFSFTDEMQSFKP
jgi:hypothetical protein